MDNPALAPAVYVPQQNEGVINGPDRQLLIKAIGLQIERRVNISLTLDNRLL